MRIYNIKMSYMTLQMKKKKSDGNSENPSTKE